MTSRYPQILYLSVAFILFAGADAALAQDAANGRRLSERWCSECHAVGGPAPAKYKGVPSFAAIAAKETITTEMITSFLRLPHATMPNVPISRKDALDIATFIMEMKK